METCLKGTRHISSSYSRKIVSSDWGRKLEGLKVGFDLWSEKQEYYWSWRETVSEIVNKTGERVI